MTRPPAMRIAILGATSQIAGDLVRSMAAEGRHQLLLYARDPAKVEQWLEQAGLAGRYPALPYAEYGQLEHDAVINFVGVGDPSRAAAMGGDIFGITLEYDELVLRGLRQHPQRRYIFLSSGAAYGSTFLEPADQHTRASIAINALTPQEYYSAAKLHAECRHRALAQHAIVDLRVFNIFSRTQDLGARFFITDIVRAIQDGSELQTSPDAMVRDFLHPSDFHRLVECVLQAPPQNVALDCYSRAPIAKAELLQAMQRHFGLRYRVAAAGPAPAVNATGAKPHYYSRNHKAAELGYRPAASSLDTVLTEAAAILGRPRPEPEHTSGDQQ
ncbi:MAG: NAD(P)-dependent oxidoreductase [Pseudomonadota bacterium]